MKWFIFAAAIILGLWGLSWFLIWEFETNPTSRGQFGDMFGAVNALFSGLAFAGVVVAIFMQREDLNLQREEMIRSSEAQESQVNALLIAAEISAEVTLIENLEAMQSLQQSAGLTPEPATVRVGHIFELLQQLRDMKK